MGLPKAILSKLRRRKNNRHKFKSEQLLQSLSWLLGELAVVEINTAIVDEIDNEPFIPWLAYRDIYLISPAYLQKENIHPSLYQPYLYLRRQLELQYTLLLADPNSQFYDPAIEQRIDEEIRIFSDPNENWEEMPLTKLPKPIDLKDAPDTLLLSQLLRSRRFLIGLRYLEAQKKDLARRDRTLEKLRSQGGQNINHKQQASLTNQVYAQTVMQLDGKVTNRYSQTLLTHPQKKLLLDLHRKSIKAGEAQWRKLIQFLLQLWQK